MCRFNFVFHLGRKSVGSSYLLPTMRCVNQGLKNLTVIEGESVTLECQISGHPTPSIIWFREDYRIESSIDFQITYERGYARLVIREAFAEDSGRFTCTATNEAGTISTSCYLLVKGVLIHYLLKALCELLLFS